MNPQQLIDGLMEKNRQLSMKNDELPSLVDALSGAEREYNLAVARKIIELKSDGQPATLILKLAAGDNGVADAKFKLDVADGVLKAHYARIKELMTAIDTYRSLLSWQREEMGRS